MYNFLKKIMNLYNKLQVLCALYMTKYNINTISYLFFY